MKVKNNSQVSSMSRYIVSFYRSKEMNEIDSGVLQYLHRNRILDFVANHSVCVPVTVNSIYLTLSLKKKLCAHRTMSDTNFKRIYFFIRSIRYRRIKELENKSAYHEVIEVRIERILKLIFALFAFLMAYIYVYLYAILMGCALIFFFCR